MAEIYKIEVNDIFLKGKQQKRVKARSLFCYWAVRELGISLTELARRLGISVAGVGYSVERGEIIARENDYQLIELISENFKGVPLDMRISSFPDNMIIFMLSS